MPGQVTYPNLSKVPPHLLDAILNMGGHDVLAAQREAANPTEESLSREKAQGHLLEYVRQAWGVLEPVTEYLHNWHIEAVCEYLEAVTSGEITRLLINMPPRYMKSTCVSVCWPTWMWLREPGSRWVFFSYDSGLATKHSLDRRRLIESNWHRSRWGHIFQMTSDQNVKTEYENDRRGVMLATGLAGSATGKGGDILVFDDPHNPNKIHSDVERTSDLREFGQASGTRLNNKRTGAIVVVMQRLHEEDISQECIDQGYEHLCLPAVAETRTTFLLPSGRAIERSAGNVLWPERDGPDELAAAKRALGSYGYAGQYQQQPAPMEGGLLKRHWWRFWYPATMKDSPPSPIRVRLADGTYHECPQDVLPEKFDQVLQSWDTTFKDTVSADYVAGGVWARKGARDGNYYLLDQVRDRMDIIGALNALDAVSAKWPNATLKLIEDKANGSAIITMARDRISGIVAIQPEGGKTSRANSVAPRIESGNVYLPHPAIAHWVQDFIEECAVFPNGKHDDQVDQMTQALMRLAKGGGVYA